MTKHKQNTDHLWFILKMLRVQPQEELDSDLFHDLKDRLEYTLEDPLWFSFGYELRYDIIEKA